MVSIIAIYLSQIEPQTFVWTPSLYEITFLNELELICLDSRIDIVSTQ